MNVFPSVTCDARTVQDNPKSKECGASITCYAIKSVAGCPVERNNCLILSLLCIQYRCKDVGIYLSLKCLGWLMGRYIENLHHTLFVWKGRVIKEKDIQMKTLPARVMSTPDRYSGAYMNTLEGKGHKWHSDTWKLNGWCHCNGTLQTWSMGGPASWKFSRCGTSHRPSLQSAITMASAVQFSGVWMSLMPLSP